MPLREVGEVLGGIRCKASKWRFCDLRRIIDPDEITMDHSSHRTAAVQRIQHRLQSIGAALAARDDALALLALGSVGCETERMDEWSDLDFFVVVRDGAKAHYIDDLSWLAAAHPLVWHFQNTPDGHKALMADGLFCEFAVFEVRELTDIPYAPGRFVWRREEVPDSLATPRRPLPGPADERWLVGEALSNLLVGLQRHARGERLAAMRMVQVSALDRVLELLERGGGPPSAQRDPFNVDRRVELRLPAAAANLAGWAPGYEGTCAAALALLAAIEARASVPEAVSLRIRALAAAARNAAAVAESR